MLGPQAANKIQKRQRAGLTKPHKLSLHKSDIKAAEQLHASK
jgi:hypothetical protein